ncbi:MAG: putative Ig domain-containing protein, partial [Bacteroidota bacterium]
MNSNFTLQANFQAVQGDLPAITEIVLINATTDQEIASINEGDEINLADYANGTQFSFVAKANGLEESVVLNLSGSLTQSKTESVPPYALYGDTNGSDYAGQSFGVGAYKIAATPFSANGGSGTAGSKVEYNFTVINDDGGTDPNATLTIDLSTDGNGSIMASPQGPYVPNTIVTITATPDAGFEFDRFNWGFGGLASTNNPFVFTISNSVKLQAIFKTGSGGGTTNNPPVVTNPGSQTSSEGQSVNLQIVANDGDSDQNQSLSYNASNLPAGLNINNNSGLISGTIQGPTSGTSGAFIEQNGLVVIEVESVPLTGSANNFWLTQSINNEPFYQTKEGQNSFNSVNNNSIITYPVQINTPGIYRVMMKSKVNT